MLKSFSMQRHMETLDSLGCIRDVTRQDQAIHLIPMSEKVGLMLNEKWSFYL